jgi:hypothetical protein
MVFNSEQVEWLRKTGGTDLDRLLYRSSQPWRDKTTELAACLKRIAPLDQQKEVGSAAGFG